MSFDRQLCLRRAQIVGCGEQFGMLALQLSVALADLCLSLLQGIVGLLQLQLQRGRGRGYRLGLGGQARAGLVGLGPECGFDGAEFGRDVGFERLESRAAVVPCLAIGRGAALSQLALAAP